MAWEVGWVFCLCFAHHHPIPTATFNWKCYPSFIQWPWHLCGKVTNICGALFLVLDTQPVVILRRLCPRQWLNTGSFRRCVCAFTEHSLEHDVSSSRLVPKLARALEYSEGLLGHRWLRSSSRVSASGGLGCGEDGGGGGVKDFTFLTNF